MARHPIAVLTKRWREGPKKDMAKAMTFNTSRAQRPRAIGDGHISRLQMRILRLRLARRLSNEIFSPDDFNTEFWHCHKKILLSERPRFVASGTGSGAAAGDIRAAVDAAFASPPSGASLSGYFIDAEGGGRVKEFILIDKHDSWGAVIQYTQRNAASAFR